MKLKEKYLLGVQLKHVVIWFLLMVFLIAPDDVFNLTGIYTAKSLSFIKYNWLDYSFSILYIIPLFLGTFYAIKRRKIGCYLFVLAVLLRSITFQINDLDNMFSYHEFEIPLTILVGFTLSIWCFEFVEKSAFDIEKFFEFFLVIHILSQLASAVLGQSGIIGRVNAINLDVESTGLLCGFSVVYFVINKRIEKRKVLILLSFIALMLSGSRIALIDTIVVLAFYFIFCRKSVDLNVNVITIIVFLIISEILIFLFVTNKDLLNDLFSSEMFSAINRILTTGAADDTSKEGRLSSIIIGLKIIKEHPLGIDAFFSNIQMETVKYGFPTYPHSTLLCTYIMFGPFILIPTILAVINKARVMYIRVNKECKLGTISKLAFLVIFITITGQPIVNYKVIFIYILLFKLCFI